MDDEQIEILIDTTGNSVKVEGRGIKGPDCEALTAEIEKAVGVQVSKRLTSEYYESPLVKRKANA